MPQNDSSPTIQISSLQFCESPLWDTTLLWNTVSPRFANCSMWLNLLFWSPASRLASQTLCWPTCPPSCCSSSSLLTLLSFPKVLPEMWASNNLPSSVLLFTGAMGLATEKSSIIDVLAVVAQPRWSDNFSPVSPISSATIVCPHRSGCPGCWISRQPDFKHCWQEPRTGECRTGNLGLQVISNLYQVTSGPQFFFWVSSSLCQALTLTSAILGPHTEGEKALQAHTFCARVRMDSSPLIHLSRTLPHCIDSLLLGGRAASLCWSCKYMHQSIFVNIICPHQGHNPDNPSPKHTASTPSRLWFGWSAFHCFDFLCFYQSGMNHTKLDKENFVLVIVITSFRK